MSFLPYPAYRENGIEWVGPVPTTWTTKRLSWLFRIISSGTTPPTDATQFHDGHIPWVTTGELREQDIGATSKMLTAEAVAAFPTLRIYPPGTLLVAMYGATIGRLGWLEVAATTNQACCAMAEPIGIQPRFCFHAIPASTEALVFLSSGGGQPNINQEKLRALRIAVPSMAEQSAIAAFLDRETGKIDALVAEQERLIALLKEKRQAVISQAVTKGLDPNAPMKDSGVEWLGEVPAHWEVKRIKHSASHVVDCLHTTPTYDGELAFPAIRTADVEPGRLLLDQARLVSADVYAERIQRLKPKHNDILYSREGERFGIAALVPANVNLCLGHPRHRARTSPNRC